MDFNAKFKLEESEEFKIKFVLNFNPSKLSELENDIFPDVENLATTVDIANALKGYATQLDVMKAIASIPKFSKSVVTELPEVGEKMVLYLVPKEGADDDIYNEYIWIDETGRFEFIGSTAVDLTGYAKLTDIPDVSNFALKSEVPKLQLITEAEYEALLIKDSNTLYCIEEENA